MSTEQTGVMRPLLRVSLSVYWVVWPCLERRDGITMMRHRGARAIVDIGNTDVSAGNGGGCAAMVLSAPAGNMKIGVERDTRLRRS